MRLITCLSLSLSICAAPIMSSAAPYQKNGLVESKKVSSLLSKFSASNINAIYNSYKLKMRSSGGMSAQKLRTMLHNELMLTSATPTQIAEIELKFDEDLNNYVAQKEDLTKFKKEVSVAFDKVKNDDELYFAVRKIEAQQRLSPDKREFLYNRYATLKKEMFKDKSPIPSEAEVSTKVNSFLNYLVSPESKDPLSDVNGQEAAIIKLNALLSVEATAKQKSKFSADDFKDARRLAEQESYPQQIPSLTFDELIKNKDFIIKNKAPVRIEFTINEAGQAIDKNNKEVDIGFKQSYLTEKGLMSPTMSAVINLANVSKDASGNIHLSARPYSACIDFNCYRVPSSGSQSAGLDYLGKPDFKKTPEITIDPLNKDRFSYIFTSSRNPWRQKLIADVKSLEGTLVNWEKLRYEKDIKKLAPLLNKIKSGGASLSGQDLNNFRDVIINVAICSTCISEKKIIYNVMKKNFKEVSNKKAASQLKSAAEYIVKSIKSNN